jgi:hypothetical protein
MVLTWQIVKIYLRRSLAVPFVLGVTLAMSMCASPSYEFGQSAVSRCDDRERNGNETAVDCGGDSCQKCVVGDACRNDSDCVSGECTNGVCRELHCGNVVMDRDEQGVDCGGADCVACSGADTCKNAGQDSGETDIDCGGTTTCDRCANGDSCKSSSDCISGNCEVAVCRGAASVSDGASGAGGASLGAGGSQGLGGAWSSGGNGTIDGGGLTASNPSTGTASEGGAQASNIGGGTYGGVSSAAGGIFGVSGGVTAAVGSAHRGGTSSTVGNGGDASGLGGTAGPSSGGGRVGAGGIPASSVNTGVASTGSGGISASSSHAASSVAGGTSSSSRNTGGTSATSTGAGGTSAASTSGTSRCSHTPVPSAPTITDFSEFAVGTTWTTGSRTWGTSSTLTGNTFHYGGSGLVLTAAITSAGALKLTSTLSSGEYVGFGLALEGCFDASVWHGISASIAGSVGSFGFLKVAVQTSKNTPLDITPGKGECTFTSQSTEWTECGYNSVAVSGVSATAKTFSYTWSKFTGGLPVDPVDPTEIVGIQFQFECSLSASSACAIDVTLDNIMFVQ